MKANSAAFCWIQVVKGLIFLRSRLRRSRGFAFIYFRAGDAPKRCFVWAGDFGEVWFFRLRMPSVTFIRSQAFRPGGESEGELLVHFLGYKGRKV